MDNEVIDASDWQELRHLNSGGTRNKKLLLNNEGVLYFFKESYNNEKGKFYKYEFYSEVIASFLGKMLGFDVLEYQIAVFNDKIGCLSQSMINEDEELIEGGKYLKSFDNTFIIENEKPKDKYTYQLIEATLKKFNLLEISYSKLIEMIIFDAIIGNSDRHQENWGFIAKNTPSLIENFNIENLEQNKKINVHLAC